MKINCDKIVVCGNYECIWNNESHCYKSTVALDINGKCALCKLKHTPKDDGGKPAPNKTKTAFDIETSK